MEENIKEFRIDELRVGMLTAAPVVTASGQQILEAKTVLTPALITRIKFYNINSVEIYLEEPEEEVSEESEEAEALEAAEEEVRTAHGLPVAPSGPVVFKNTETVRETQFIKTSDHIIAPSGKSYSELVKTSGEFHTFESQFSNNLFLLRDIFTGIYHKAIPLDPQQALDNIINPLVKQCKTSIDFFDKLHNMRQINDSVYAHCMNVSMIAYQIGLWLKLSQEDLDVLAVAGLFHDIGKMKLPESVLNKQERLTEDEYQMIRKHPRYGYDIIKDFDIDTRIKKAALQHHERCDSTGYPLGLNISEMDYFAKIIAIADVYDAMTAARIYRSALCPFQVIAEFEKDGLQKYDPKILMTFMENIAKTYQNNRVLLSNGVSANIVLLNRSHLSQPVVQINDGSCIDLARSELFIKALI